jgi:pimeloyl-ACP methyl ester carboxylesterase
LALNGRTSWELRTARTLVITGDADRIVPLENSINLAAAIPEAKLVVMPGGSHLFFIEEPGDFNAAVIEFINGIHSSQT